MYIPVTYWNNQLATAADLNIRYFTLFPVQNFSYTYDNVTLSGSATVASVVVPVCMDVVEAEDIVLNKPNIAGSSFFCNASFSGSSQCCINSYPNTGVEAWYIDISYSSKIGDVGLQYYNYINENGTIVNDSIGFNQTKRIISQCNPMALREAGSNFFGVYVNWTIVSKFPGQVLAYPFKDIPCNYTLQLKRDSAQSPGTYTFPRINSQRIINTNGFWQSSPSASTISGVGGSLNSTIIISSSLPPLDAGSVNNSYGSAVWVTNVTPKEKGALLLSSCQTTHSLWVTLNNYDYYNTGNIIKVSNPQLTSTSSCWTVNNLTSSLSTTVSLNDVNVTASSFSSCFICVSGSLTASLDVEYLLVAGGGGGGASFDAPGGAGGGAGGLLSGSFTLQTGSLYNVNIGLGGKGGFNTSGSNGQSSSVFGLVAIGGGGGAAGNTFGSTGSVGGSGGGSAPAPGDSTSAVSGGLGTIGQGNNGGASSMTYAYVSPSGGGGGAASAGTAGESGLTPNFELSAGNGGSGSQWLDGNYYAGGGAAGGGGLNSNVQYSGSIWQYNAGKPGIGGGGSGGFYSASVITRATNGTPNRGAGGGGGAGTNVSSFNTPGSGSSGVCIIRYPGTKQLVDGGSVVVSGSYVYHTFNQSSVILT